ncbi:hypothetical protein ACHAPE_007316 [Trichoderma viride]
MVGIGGGAPNFNAFPPKDVRLGDVVVSIPNGKLGGVIKYDRGKVMNGGEFQHTGLLNNPPALLTAAVQKLRSRHEFRRNSVSKYVSQMIEKMANLEDANPDIENMYQYQGSEYDQLFKADYEHDESGQIFNTSERSQDTTREIPQDPRLPCPSCDKERLVKRGARRTTDAVIHYGTIASADQVMRHGITRENLQRKYDILCFEMEAAGLMNDFPCLVIRGICDYSDTHKHKIWQRYAAAAAAAYAKELLGMIPGEDIEKAEDATKVLEKARFKDHIAKWQPGTTEHLLNSKEFLNWRDKNTQTLWCHGIQGAGKTIFASVVIKRLQDSREDKETIREVGIAFLYCEYDYQRDQTPIYLLKGILRQLTGQINPLPVPVSDLYDLHIQKRSEPTLDEMSSVLSQVIQNFTTVFLVVDALDECLEYHSRKLLAILQKLQHGTIMKILVTSRFDVPRDFGECNQLIIRADESDIKVTLSNQADTLPQCIRYDDELLKQVVNRATKAADGMFVLALIFLDTLKDLRSKGLVEDELRKLETSPDKLSTVYEGAIRRIDDGRPNDRETARRAISLVVHARRVLTCQELQHALAVMIGSKQFQENYIIEHLEEVIDLCAGLIAINQKSNTVQLRHYTTREYFHSPTHQLDWIDNAQREVTRICVTYLSFNDFKSGFCESHKEFEIRLNSYKLYNYAAQYWGYHAREALALDQEVMDFLECEPNVEASSQALMTAKSFRYYSQFVPRHMTGLHLAAYFGIREAIRPLLSKQSLKLDSFGRTALWYAVANKHVAVAELLLAKNGVDVNAKDESGRAPLMQAIEKRSEVLVRLLLAKDDIDMNTRGKNDRTPLLWAASFGYKEVVKLLLTKDGVNVNARDKEGRTPLWYAAANKDAAVVKLLLSQGGINVNAEDKFSCTPLSWAASEGHEAIVKLLLTKDGVNVNARDKDGRTPLWYAAANKDAAVVKLLLNEGGINANGKDRDGRTPLLQEAEKGSQKSQELVKLLLVAEKVNLKANDNDGCTLLSRAAANGYETVVKLLLESESIDINMRNNEGWTPLMEAAVNGHRSIIELLLQKGSNLSAKHDDGWATLLKLPTNGQLGWCLEAKCYAGTSDINYTIGESGLPKVPWLQLSIKDTIIKNGVIIKITSKDGPISIMRERATDMLQWITTKFFVLWDEEDERGWLLNGASALLHLLRASLEHDSADQISKYNAIVMEVAPEPRYDHQAIRVLLKLMANRDLKVSSVGNSHLSFRDRIENLFNVLEKVIDNASYQTRRASGNRSLKGWEFMDIARCRDVRFHRTTRLRSFGTGWIDLTRAIGAVTLFGRGFGEIIRPASANSSYALWTKMPKGRYYLAASFSDLQRIAERHGDLWTESKKLSSNIIFSDLDVAFELCHSTGRVVTIKSPIPLKGCSAVILGHKSESNWFPEDIEYLEKSKDQASFGESESDVTAASSH